MESTLHVRAVATRFRLPEECARDRDRVQRAWQALTTAALQRALDQEGLPPGGEVCIRRLQLHLRLWLGQTDEAMVAEWAAVVAREIRRELESGRSDNVLRFASPLYAVIDAVRGLARGATERAWAWRQLDLPIEGPVPDAIVALLVHNPLLALPALAVLAGDEAFVRCAAGFDGDAFAIIARAALDATGRSTALQASAPPTLPQRPGRMVRQPVPPPAEDDERNADDERDLEPQAIRILARSPLRPLAERAALSGRASCEALAVLIVLATEPSALDRGRRHAAAMINAIAHALRGGASSASQGARRPAASTDARPASPSPGDDVVADRQMRGDDIVSTTGGAIRTPEAAGSTIASPSNAAAGLPPADASPSPAAAKRSQEELPTTDAPAGIRDDFAERPLDLRRQGSSEWGGLLFLLHAVADAEIHLRAVGAPALAGHSVAWAMHQIAMLLVACEPCDPAALAFAGLPPDARPPEEHEPSADAAATLLDLATAVRLATAERLAMDPEASDLYWVCARRAEVVADPGWFDVRFPLGSVSLRVRRAGLDLDPGYVPWLGVVVRFTYA